MRKALASLVALGLLVGASASPALAGKKKTKTISDSVAVTALPFPNYSSHTATPTPGCTAGQEGVHKLSIPIETPGAGKFTAAMAGFTGDWDLYLFDDAGVIVGRSENAQADPAMAPAEESIEVALAAKKTYQLVVCNWAGAPQATVDYTYVYKA